MSRTPAQSEKISIRPYLPSTFSARPALVRVIDSALGLTRLDASYRRLPRTRDPLEFTAGALKTLDVTVQSFPDELARIPATGPCLVVANHPHGALDGLCLVDLLLRLRADVKVLAAFFLGEFVELRPLLVEVDPFGGRDARRYNAHSARSALRWLEQGGLVLMFPGGEVSSLDLSQRAVIDPPWQHGAARLARRSGAAVVAVHIDGRNGNLFQLGGLMHPRFRTMLLVRELLKPHRAPIGVRVAPPIAWRELAALGSDAAVSAFLRARTYLLPHAARVTPNVRPIRGRGPLALARDTAALSADIARLPAERQLLVSGKFQVYCAGAAELPNVLLEIGRLREESFRAVGEGTGKDRDLDPFDAYYEQLFIWDSEAGAIAGGYRLGAAPDIIRARGLRGLYVASLFKVSPRLALEMLSGLELGRSFVCAQYQRSFSPLMLLWKGIAAYVACNPRYRFLFGPVSISNAYHPVSQRILVQFLARHYSNGQRGALARPRRPVAALARTEPVVHALHAADTPLLDGLLKTIEADGKGVPVLLRQYLKLGGKILGFNVDPAFSHVVDCLLWVDLHTAPPGVLAKYMGADQARVYRDQTA
jgi:putative hemolysin